MSRAKTKPPTRSPSGACSCTLKCSGTVEARGVEPRSEIRSTTASTCVARRLGSAVTGRRAAHYCTSLLRISPSVKRPDARLSRYCDTRNAASGGLHHEQGAATPKSYAARARFELAVMILPSVLPGLCTWARSHSFTDPVESRSPPWTTRCNVGGAPVCVKFAECRRPSTTLAELNVHYIKCFAAELCNTTSA